MTSLKLGCVTPLLEYLQKQILHSFCVYNQHLTNESGSRHLGSVVEHWFSDCEILESIPVGVEPFSAMPYFFCYGFHFARQQFNIFSRKLSSKSIECNSNLFEMFQDA